MRVRSFKLRSALSPPFPLQIRTPVSALQIGNPRPGSFRRVARISFRGQTASRGVCAGRQKNLKFSPEMLHLVHTCSNRRTTKFKSTNVKYRQYVKTFTSFYAEHLSMHPVSSGYVYVLDTLIRSFILVTIPFTLRVGDIECRLRKFLYAAIIGTSDIVVLKYFSSGSSSRKYHWQVLLPRLCLMSSMMMMMKLPILTCAEKLES